MPTEVSLPEAAEESASPKGYAAWVAARRAEQPSLPSFVPASVGLALSALHYMEVDLDDVSTYEQIVAIERAAEALRALYKSVEEVQVRASKMVILANHRIGEEIKKMPMAKAGRPPKEIGTPETPISAPTLSDLAGNKTKALRLKKLAAHDKDEVAAVVERMASSGKDVTVTGVVKELAAGETKKKREARVAATATSDTCTVSDLSRLVADGRKFGTIYADPPWLYDNQGTRAATGNHYDGLTVDKLCELPIADLAADDAHLHLWTTNAFLFECPRLFEAWGFEFRSTFVWIKPQMGIGNYWRNSHEIMLTAIRGNAKRFSNKSLKSWVQCDRGKHSDKPDQVRSYLELASPGPRLELFGRRAANGWVVWGDQIERSLFNSDASEIAA